MTPPYPGAKSIFLNAMDLAAEGRAAHLEAACGGDARLRAEVDALLAAHDRAGSFLGGAKGAPGDGPHPGTLPRATPPEDGDGTGPGGDRDEAGAVLAGRYKLVERIGEGGMGTVWLAQQTEPVKRRVAVKLVKAGMDSRSVLARFEAERQALAMMDHPNIAKVLDAGLTPDGRPFFVMELVKGVPITDYCDARKLTPRERLELFVPVCMALQHAHQKGVIHRDVKPSNVLVALYDDRAVPKVIDFGVAKATGGALTEQTLNTGFGGVVGTPQYMSPEQATLNNLDIDTRSDVYSLGVLLYELLAGSPPFARPELEKRGLLEILRVVREEEPPRPSNKLSTADVLPTLSANRATEPMRLTGLLRNELDWIVMKALEKDRARRYETANGFAADVNRYLAGEAVLAHPPSAAYRLRKAYRKNRGPVVAAGMVVFALAAGVVGTALALVEARNQEATARQEAFDKETARAAEADRAAGERREKEKAETQQRRAEAGEKLAGERLAQATAAREDEAAATEFYCRYLTGQADYETQFDLGFVPVPDLTLRAALDRAGNSIGDRFRNRPAVEAAVRRTIGETHLALHDHRKAVAQLEPAVERAGEAFGIDSPKHLAVRRSLAKALYNDERYAEGNERMARIVGILELTRPADDPELLATLRMTGEMQLAHGNRPKGIELLHRVASVQTRRLGADHPDAVYDAFTVVWAGGDPKAIAAAVPGFERAVAARVAGRRPDDSRNFEDEFLLANAFLWSGRTEDAIPRLERMCRRVETIGGKIPDFPRLVLAEAYRSVGRWDDAIKLFREIYQRRVALYGADDFRTLWVGRDMARSLWEGGQRDAAVEQFR